MFGNTGIAFFAGLGLAIFVYRLTAYKGTGDYFKQLAPAAIAGILGFLVTLTVISVLFD